MDENPQLINSRILELGLMRNFKELSIWKTGMNIALKTINYSDTLPFAHKLSLGNQMNRAAFSIPANIAEGCSRRGQKDKSRFIEIATGSCFELETHLLVAQTAKMGDQKILSLILKLIQSEGKMLTRYSQALSAS